ncbi:2OG-Fe(II) oxygenase [Wenyingzhuangia sp. IMCC45467]
MNNELTTEQEELQFEVLIDGLLNNQYGFTESFLDINTISGLRNNLFRYRENGEMYPAGIGKKFDYQKNTLVRGDLIKWFDENTTDIHERLLLDKINRFITYLNSTCYTSINASEFHYATYEVNSFYKRHLDQFKSEKGRKFSLVIYLNEDWSTEDGGKLSLYINENKIDDVYPLEGRAVFFKSDELEHEVHPSFTRNRISIAGWLKSV